MWGWPIVCILLSSLGAATLADDGVLLSINCATCSCMNTTSCAKLCEAQAVGKGRVEPFYDLLSVIGSTCSVYASIQVASELSSEDYCVSTIEDRPGWVVQSPNIASYGLGVKEAEVMECWLRLWVNETWSCDPKLRDGYHVYGAEVAPSPFFCGLPNLPAGLSLAAYDVEQDTVRISLGYLDQTVRAGGQNTTEAKTYPLSGHALAAVRYNSAQRTQEGKCFGAFSKASWVTALQGVFYGTDHTITGYKK